MLPDDAKIDLLAGAHLCRQRPGTWNAVSADQFGEQTYIKKGKMPGGLKGLTMSEDQVAIWVESYPICAYVTLAIESTYSADDEMKEEKRKEEGKKRGILDTDDRNHVYEELKKHFRPLKLTSSSLYNIINGKVANASVNIQETLKMGDSMLLDFRSSLPGGFHAPLKRNVKPMEPIKCCVAGDKTFYDMASLICRLITVGQHRQVKLQTPFDYALCAVPASIIDEYGFLRTGTKSTLVFKLKVDDLQPDAPDIVIVDGQQLLYHIVWSCAGSASDLANIMKDRLGQYQPTEVLVIFDRYDDMSAKDHERIRHAGEGAVNYNITTSSKLPCRDAIM